MKRNLLSVIIFFVQYAAFGQQNKPVNIIFEPVFGKEAIETGKPFKLNGYETVEIETLKFYISNIELLQNQSVVYKEENSFHLIDIEKNSAIDLNLSANIRINTIRFNLGIDSTTHAMGAMGGDLDPTKGMYWTWQSGYINCKLEGSLLLNNGDKKELQYHVGGYQAPFNTIQKVSLKIKSKEKIMVYLDVRQLMESIDMDTLHHLMSPNKDAVLIAALLAKCFYIK